MRRRYYLAYGSNLNMQQMKMRCLDAKPVGITFLQDYGLLFRGGNSSAVATVEPKLGCTVPCGLWLVSAKDEVALDRYEGWPYLYRKELVPVQLGLRRMKVMVYIMNDGHDIGIPSIHYYNTIRNGYRDFELDTAALEAALKNTYKTIAP
ncbi:MAG: gamma-glutamylcyclotransferase family protein [Candidatus Saccharimonadales bacterium]